MRAYFLCSFLGTSERYSQKLRTLLQKKVNSSIEVSQLALEEKYATAFVYLELNHLGSIL